MLWDVYFVLLRRVACITWAIVGEISRGAGTMGGNKESD